MNAPRLRLPIVLCACASLSGFVGACANREHIRDDFGLKARTFLQKQHVHAEAAIDAPTGLDSEEASLIQGTYRKDMGGGEGKGDESSDVMIIEKPKGQSAKGK